MVKPQTARIHGESYVLCTPADSFWKIYVKKDGNEQVYEPTYRTGWADGGEVEFFSLLPPEACGDTLLIQIRIYTHANTNQGVEGHKIPPITAECNIPAFVHYEPEKHRILLTLLCRLEARPQEHRLMVKPHPEVEIEFLQKASDSSPA